jgi:hypothetical protein
MEHPIKIDDLGYGTLFLENLYVGLAMASKHFKPWLLFTSFHNANA